MIYLNEDYEGGETKFDKVTIKPKTGTDLCFIHEQKHEGCPILNRILERKKTPLSLFY